VLKGRFSRFFAVLGALAIAASMISLAVASTGAYFTDSKGGQITGNLGTVAVDIAGQNINFANLLPGVDQTQTVTVHNTGSANEDMYLAFDNSNLGWSAVNDLGAYGIFTVNGVVYNNLNNAYAAGTTGAPVISTNSASGCYNVVRPAIAYLPHVIPLATLAPGQVWTFDVSFHFNACMTGGNGTGASLWSAADAQFPTIGPVPLLFKVAAFQQGVNPNDQMNGSGKIAPLTLPISGDTRTPAGTFQ
jgi:hypothetical protein